MRTQTDEAGQGKREDPIVVGGWPGWGGILWWAYEIKQTKKKTVI